MLEVTEAVPPEIAIAEGVHSIQAGNARNVNGLTSQRLTDAGGRQHVLRQPDRRAGLKGRARESPRGQLIKWCPSC